MPTFQEFSIKVESKDASRLYQEIAFQHGFSWPSEGMKVKHTSQSYLFFENRNLIVYAKRVDSRYPLLKSPSFSDFVDALEGNYPFSETEKQRKKLKEKLMETRRRLRKENAFLSKIASGQTDYVPSKNIRHKHGHRVKRKLMGAINRINSLIKELNNE